MCPYSYRASVAARARCINPDDFVVVPGCVPLQLFLNFSLFPSQVPAAMAECRPPAGKLVVACVEVDSTIVMTKDTKV